MNLFLVTDYLLNFFFCQKRRGQNIFLNLLFLRNFPDLPVAE